MDDQSWDSYGIQNKKKVNFIGGGFIKSFFTQYRKKSQLFLNFFSLKYLVRNFEEYIFMTISGNLEIVWYQK